MPEKLPLPASMADFSLATSLSELKTNSLSSLEKKATLTQLKEKQAQQKFYLDSLIASAIDLFDQEQNPNPQLFINLIDQVSSDAFIAGVGFNQTQKDKMYHTLQTCLTYQYQIKKLLQNHSSGGEIIFELIGHRFPPALQSQLRQLPLLAYQKHGLLHLEVTRNEDFDFIINQLYPQNQKDHRHTCGIFIKAQAQLSSFDFALYKDASLFRTNPHARHEAQHFFQHLIDQSSSLPMGQNKLNYILTQGYQGVKDEILAYAKQGDLDFTRNFLPSSTQKYNYLQNYNQQLTPTELNAIALYYKQLIRSELAFQAFAHQNQLPLNQVIAFFATLPLPQWVKATKNYAQSKNHHLFYNFAQKIKQNNLNQTNKDSYFQLLQWCDYQNQTDFHHYLQFAKEASQFADEDSFLLTHKFLSRYQTLAQRYQPDLLTHPATQKQINQLQQWLEQKSGSPAWQFLSHLTN